MADPNFTRRWFVGEGLDRGQLVFDWTGAAGRPANAAVVRAIHIPAMKQRLLEAIG